MGKNIITVKWIFRVQLLWYHVDITYKCILASHFTYLEIISTFISISVFEFLNKKILTFMFEIFPALLRNNCQIKILCISDVQCDSILKFIF